MTLTEVQVATEIDFEAETILDSGIQFPHPLSAGCLSPRHVFLTGATGFLGGYLLGELLEKSDATLHCLVRAADDLEAYERLEKQVRSLGLWQPDFSDRVRAVAGDLEHPLFGLSPQAFEDLASRMDVIYHSGGWMNMAFPYERLKAVNVEGTIEIIRFAGTARTKPVHFVSSIAVFFSEEHEDGRTLEESDTPHFHKSLRSGYSRSKWVADRLVSAAQQRGLPACIYRPVRIMGHSQTGESCDMDDILPILLKGCLLLGSFPSFDIKIMMVPVDYVARSMVHLAGREQSWGRAFHFFNPAPIQWGTLMEALRSMGYPLRELSSTEWWQELKARARQPDDDRSSGKRFFAKLVLAMTAPHFLFYKRPPFGDEHTREGLRGTGIGCPPVDRSLITTYMKAWQRSGYMPVPGR